MLPSQGTSPLIHGMWAIHTHCTRLQQGGANFTRCVATPAPVDGRPDSKHAPPACHSYTQPVRSPWLSPSQPAGASWDPSGRAVSRASHAPSCGAWEVHRRSDMLPPFSVSSTLTTGPGTRYNPDPCVLNSSANA